MFTTVWTQQRGNAARERVNQGLKMSELCLPCWACQGFLPGWFLMGRLSLGLCSSLEPDTPPAGVRLNLATAENHVALLGSLGLGFFFWEVNNKVMSVQQKIGIALQVFYQGR